MSDPSWKTPLEEAGERVGCLELLDETALRLRELCGPEGDELIIERLVVGIHFVGVKLSNGCGGVAYLPPELVQQGSTRILKSRIPRVRGLGALAVAVGALEHPLASVIRLATLNALSVPFMKSKRYLVDESGDLSSYSVLFEGRRVCLVGAIIPLIKKIRHLPARIEVIDRKEATEAEAEGLHFVRPERMAEALGSCETAVFTGASVANGSVLGLLERVPPDAVVVVVGPSAGFLPDALFQRGVAMVGTSLVSDIDEALEILSEGGGGYQLFGRCVQKINIINSSSLIKRTCPPPGGQGRIFMIQGYEDYLKEASDLHGDACMGIELGTRMTMSGLARLGLHDPKGADRKKLIVFVEIDRCATDAIMAITGCRPGKRTMKVLDYGKMAATFVNLDTGKAVRVCPQPRMRKLSREEGAPKPNIGAIPEEELLQIQEVEVTLLPEDLPGKPLTTCHCDACGEKIMDGREVERLDHVYCRPCFQKNHYYHVL